MYRLRRAKLEDAKILYDWRNDKITKKMSLNSEEISYEGHLKWLGQKLISDKTKIYILENKKTAIGTGRIDLIRGCFFLSWTISPEKRGLGLGRVLIKMLISKHDNVCYAKIKKSNGPSIRIAKENGFELYNEEEESDTYIFRNGN